MLHASVSDRRSFSYFKHFLNYCFYMSFEAYYPTFAKLCIYNGVIDCVCSVFTYNTLRYIKHLIIYIQQKRVRGRSGD